MLPKYEATHSFSQKLRGALLAVSLTIPLFLGAVLINVIQIVFLVVKPFSPAWYQKLNQSLGFSWWGTTVFIMEKLRKMQVVITGDEIPLKENAVVIVNHQGMADVAPIFCLAYRKQRLGQLKWFAKDIIKYFPGAGWGIYLAGHFMVKRSWAKDEKKINKVFARAIRDNERMWIISFLEGTRLTPEKLKASQDYCRKHNRPVLKHLLAPRTKGFEATVKALRKQLDAVYDVTIAFPEGTPKLYEFLYGYISKMNIHVRRFSLASLPQTEQELKEWVWKLFEEKDELLSYFIQHKQFPSSTGA